MDEERLRTAVAQSTAFFRALGRAGDGARIVQPDGVLAVVVPLCPERSVVNGVVHDGVAHLEAAYPELERLYADAGVRAWTVWVEPRDRDSIDLLTARGHVLDGEPETMAMGIGDFARPADDGSVRWSRGADPALVGAINDAAYGYDESFERVLGAVPEELGEWYVAYLDGRPASTLVTFDEGVNVDVDMVATLPGAQGRGLAGFLIGQALADARERGCETTTLVATAAGRPVYERLGYQALGPIQMWERRGGATQPDPPR